MEILRIDDSVIQTSLGAVIQEDGVEHFPSGTGEPEGDIGNPQDRTAAGQRLLDQAQAFNRLRRGADVVLIPCAHRKDQRVKNNIFRRDAVFLH